MTMKLLNGPARIWTSAVTAIKKTVAMVTEIPRFRRYHIHEYPFTPTAHEVQADDSVPFRLPDELRNNPDRGFRGEIYITLGSRKAYPAGEETCTEHLEAAMAKYRRENIQLYQLYVYLHEYYDRPLTEEALRQLTDFLLLLQKRGIRVLMRFAYEYDRQIRKGPTTGRIVAHTDQLRRWFRENASLVDKTVYAMQLGMVGLWGEGHSSVHLHDKRTITDAVLAMVPETMVVMMRYPSYLSAVSDRYESRSSIHDDYLVGIEHRWGMIPFHHPDYEALIRKCKFSLTDGEMPWGADKTVPHIDPILFLRQCVNYGLRTLSIEHNYREDGHTYHLEKWKQVMLSASQLEENNFPYLPCALTEERIPVYDYLELHLGYLLAATNLRQYDGRIEFDLVNYGMGAPLYFEMETRIDGKEAVMEFNPTDLRQFSAMHLTFNCTSELAIRFRHIRDHSLHIRLANDVPYKDGYHYFLFSKK